MGRYSYTTGGRVLPLLVFAVCLVFAVFVIVQVITEQNGPGLIFLALWLGALAWNAYWWLWRVSYRIEVDGDRLRWMTPLRHGEARVQDVEEVRPWLTRQVSVIALSGQQDLLCQTRNGMPDFAAALAGDRPVPVKVMVPLGERIGIERASAFERDG